MISSFGLITGLALLIFLSVRGLSILIAAPLCAALVAATSEIAWMPPLAAPGAPDFMTAYMAGFTSFFADWFIMFLLGAIFGEVMRLTGAADSLARAIINRFGPDHALSAVVLTCAILTYGGVSVFIVSFSVYPIALSIFREADLPRRFIPAAIAFGSVTFTMTSAGSPEIQNLIPMQYLGTKATAAWEISLIVAFFMAIAGFWWLNQMVSKATGNGEHFDERATDPQSLAADKGPDAFTAMVPLLLVFGVFLLTQYPAALPGTHSLLGSAPLGKWGLVVALGAGSMGGAAIGWRCWRHYGEMLSTGASGAVIAIVNTCAVVGFGSIAKLSPAFLAALEALKTLPGDPLIGSAIAVTVIAGLTGSASGGQTIALPLVAQDYLDAGANPNELHRVVAIASGALDSLPHNGFIVTLIQAICGEKHKTAYLPVGALTVVIPVIGLSLALGLFILF